MMINYFQITINFLLFIHYFETDVWVSFFLNKNYNSALNLIFFSEIMIVTYFFNRRYDLFRAIFCDHFVTSENGFLLSGDIGFLELAFFSFFTASFICFKPFQCNGFSTTFRRFSKAFLFHPSCDSWLSQLKTVTNVTNRKLY
jgi:hypothetical protein